MLERTATSIEPCSSSLQRALPSARSSRLQSRRKLHTAFWNHGAAEFELLDACQALLRLPSAQPTAHERSATPDSKRPDVMGTPSAFLLEFLYPRGTAALLRRPFSMHPVRLEGASRPHSPVSRLFTSAAAHRSAPSPDLRVASGEPVSIGEEGHEERKEEGDRGFGEEQDEEERELARDGAVETVGAEAGLEGSEVLREMLQSRRAGTYDQIFQVYNRLPADSKDEFKTDVLLAISRSSRPIEAWRVNELFAQYRVDDWTEALVRAAVKAQLILRNDAEAMAIFGTAMERRGFGKALDYLLAYGFELALWDMVLDAWSIYFRIKGQQPLVSETLVETVAETVAAPTDSPTEGQPAGISTGSTGLRDDELGTKFADAPKSAPSEVRSGTEEPTSEAASESKGAPNAEPMAADPTADKAVERVDTSTAEQIAEPASADNPPTMPSDDPGLALPSLAATARFGAKVTELYEFVGIDAASNPQRVALVDALLTHLLRHSLTLFDASDVVLMLDRVKDAHSYERFIALNVEQERKRLAGDLYKKYRTLARPRVPESVLRIMIDVFFPHNVAGMEQLLEDWYRGYGRLDERAYRKFMAFYGGRGDVKSIKRLAGEYAKHYDSKVEQDPEHVTTLMQAHAVRGDPHAVRQVLEEAVERSGEPPVIKQWNILLNAHSKAGDYGGAVDLFWRICDEHEPDGYTFGTMMGMSGFRGDLQFTLELFHLARAKRVQPTVAMMRALVDAYCQNDRFSEAESLCVRITKQREMEGDYTLLWNALLRHHARRRDLTTINRLLEFMSSQGIAYNQDTYSQLLLALLYARQSHHAMHLLRVAQREGVFEPTADHFVLLMAAFINSGEPHMALRTNELMAKMNFPESAMRMTKVIDALGRWQELPVSKRRGLEGEHYLKIVLRGFYKAMEREDQGSPDDIRSVINLYSKVLFVLTQMRQFVTVQQIIRLHNSRYPGRASRETIPLKLLHQIMLADFFEKKYDSVKETWALILERSAKRYAPASARLDREDPDGPPKPVIYAQRFRLCDPLKTMQRLYLELQDADGLLDLVATVRRYGFDLDSKNWNYHVQALARLKRWREAFTTCERVLMPQWSGWYALRTSAKMKNQLPLELRRIGSNPQRPRPIAHTLLVLAKEYMDLEQMMLWSPEASKEFDFITAECPRTVKAVTTMHRSDSPLEARIFGEEVPAVEGDDGGDRAHLDSLYPDRGAEDSYPEPGVREHWGPSGGGLQDSEGGQNETGRRESNVPYDDIWTDDGFLKAGEPAERPKRQRSKRRRTKEDTMSEVDIVTALKGD